MKTNLARGLAAGFLTVALTAGLLEHSGGGAPAAAKTISTPDAMQLRQRMSALEIPFEANIGQQNKQVAFTARALGGTLFVTRAGELVYSFPGRVPGQTMTGRDPHKGLSARGPGWALSESFTGAHIVPRGNAASVTRVNRFIGSDPKNWRSSIPTFGRIALGEAWPGIAVALAAHGDSVEKLFTLAPGANAARIVIGVRGAMRLALDGSGALIAQTGDGPVSFSAPRAWQDIAGKRRPVRVAYTLSGNSYGFHVSGYDAAYPVEIDPILQSTYLGDNNNDVGYSVAVDAAGYVLVAGNTYSTTFPGTAGGAQTTSHSWTNPYNYEGFIAKLNNALTVLVQATYLGGSGDEYPYRIALDGSGNVFVTGSTTSTDFPTTSGVAQAGFGGGNEDAFVAKLNGGLTTLLRSTYIGGGADDEGHGLALSANGDVFVAGSTTGAFPHVAGGAQSVFGGGTAGNADAFAAKLNNNLTTIVQATYLGGAGHDYANAIALDASGNVFISGGTAGLPAVTGGAQAAYGGGYGDAFVAKFNNGLTTLIKATYLGGSGFDYATSLALDAAGNVFAAGATGSTNFPDTIGGAQALPGGGAEDGFIAKLNNGLTVSLQATYLGGSGNDYVHGMALDPIGNVFVVGETSASNFPGTTGGAQPALSGGSDAFISRLNNGLTALAQSTYLGGSGYDFGMAIALDASNELVVAGYTTSTNFPALTPASTIPGTANGARPIYAWGNYDAFASKLTHGLHDLAHSVGYNDGDPHITTISGVLYTFQSVGEFTALRDLPGFEIQTRQSAMPTWAPYTDAYTGLKTCVSVNTAMAARVGTHRVTFEPDFNNPASGMVLRVDGVTTSLPAAGLNLSGGGHLAQLPGALEIDFPDGAILTVPAYQVGTQWVIHVDGSRLDAREGLMGAIASGSWLPALPNGGAEGPMPPSTLTGMHQRFVVLNRDYANAWRVNGRTSLFDYGPGTSTATFTNPSWPVENATTCVVPNMPPPPKPITAAAAQDICRAVTDKTANANCVFDVMATGRPEFSKGYQISQHLHDGVKTPMR